ncbi:MAG TPA: glutamate--tRNA ligase family protein, partial [Pirellulaceae bacterium]|nr:glutamate--tRNA ligase family protein [Pirellulaceae bacterium]
ATKDRYPTYQLAVVIDDNLQSITDVIRGIDLLDSTARQMLIQRLLGMSPVRYWHTPLVVGPDGLRLAKRHGDTRVEYYAEHGVRREQIWGLLGFWAGLHGQRQPLAAEEFVAGFCLENLPLQTIVFDREDHDWLMELATR